MALLLHLYRQPGSRRVPLSDGGCGLIIGVCLWLAPQLALTGGIELLHHGLAFTSGHFSEWGGTLVSSATPEHQQWLYRVTMFAWGFTAYSLGFWWTDTSLLRLLPSLVMLIAFGLSGSQARWEKRTGFLLLYTLPYGLWVIIAQHAEQPRHLLPLIPVALMLLALGLKRLRRLSTAVGSLACALLLVALGGLSTRLVIVHRLTPPPRLQVLQYVTQQFESASTRLYAWGTRRMFAFYAPTFDVRQRRHVTAAQQDLERSRQRPAILLATSDVQGVTTSPHMHLVQRFERDRYVHHPHWQVELYRWCPPGYAPLAATGRRRWQQRWGHLANKSC